MIPHLCISLSYLTIPDPTKGGILAGSGEIEIESYIHFISKSSRKNWENKVLLTLTVIVADYILAMNII
jgi:hypothetical protein